jgi:hypothetical protein
MSLWGYFDREERETEILHDIRTGIANLAAQDGETQLANDIQAGFRHDYVTAPASGVVLGVPAGEMTVDFEQGRVTHESVGELVSNDEHDDQSMRSIADLDVDASHVRSLAMGTDTPGYISLDRGDRSPIAPGQFVVQAQRFREVELEFFQPASIAIGASTRADPHVDAATQVRLSRTGAVPLQQADSWTDVDVVPVTLSEFVDKPASVGDAGFEVGGQEMTTITVENSGANELEARLLVAEQDASSTFRQAGDAITVASGDHGVINLQEAHRLAKVQIENTTAGDSVAAEVDVTGRNA